MNLETLVLPLKTEDNAFRAGISRVTQLVQGAIEVTEKMVKATFQWADELDHLTDIMDISNKKAAAYNFVLRKSGVATDTFAKGVVILEKGLVKADGSLDSAGKKLEDFGINVLDANGGLKDQNLLMDEITAKYSDFSTQQEKVNFLTDVFGKSGAELIDFFDTLAQEGGIDKVAEKVERLGLAIDPGRYEQFNRNLEELKMIGLGLSVSFTEAVMPALESFLGIITDPDMTFTDKVAALTQSAGEFISTWYSSLQKFIGNINWNQVSVDIAAGINSINWAQAGLSFSNFVKDTAAGLANAVKEFDWLAVGNALASALNNFFAGIFGMTEAQLQQIVKETLWGLSKDIENWVNNILSYLQGLGLNVKAGTFTMPKPDMSHVTSGPSSGGGSGGGGVQAGNYSYNNGVYTLNRASGGPIVPGQDYNVAEFWKPEKFTSNSGGRIDPMNGSQPVTAQLDEERLARLLTSVLQPLLS